jgi:hypothetical protein
MHHNNNTQVNYTFYLLFVLKWYQYPIQKNPKLPNLKSLF